MSIKRKILYGCLCAYAAGTVLRIALDRHWHSVKPHVVDVVTGQTYALGSRSGTIFVTPLEGHLFDILYFLPPVFLVAGMLVWATAWREWR